MIAAHELRIGNLIYRKWGSASEKEVREMILPYFSQLDRLEPIPITEEWLIKLGFVIDDITEHFTQEKVYIKYYNDFGIKIEENGLFYNGIYQQKLEYIHQLQNLYFALTQEELELK